MGKMFFYQSDIDSLMDIIIQVINNIINNINFNNKK